MSLVTDVKCVTNIHVYQINCSWEINNFNFCCKRTGDCITSMDFTHSKSDKWKWHLKLYPFGSQKDYENHLSIYLTSSIDLEKETKVTYQFTIKDVDGKEIKGTAPQTSYLKTSSGYGFSKLIPRNDVLNLKDDILVITCQIKWSANITDACHYHKPSKILNLSHQIGSDFSKLYKDNTYSDVILKSNDGGEFPVHRCVLAARSSVFDAMFKHGMKESQQNSVEIDDIDQTTLQALLEFIYLNKFEKDENSTDQLLVAADKYAIDSLKQLCEEELCKHLSIENAVDCLLLADQYTANILKNDTLTFITVHLKALLQTEAIKKLETDKPTLYKDILDGVANIML